MNWVSRADYSGELAGIFNETISYVLLSAGKVEGATVLLWGHPEKVFKKAVWILEGMMNVVMDLNFL